MASAIAGICESEHTALTGWFNITSGFGSSDRITVTVQSISKGGANNFGYSSGRWECNQRELPPLGSHEFAG